MPASATLVAAAALALLAARPASAFFVLDHSPLVRTRLDPIVNPGGISAHEHNVLGGSRFGATYDYDDLMKSKCTTAPISIDKSNYWAAQLYYHDSAANTFEAIPNWARTYYLNRPGPKKEKIHAFPAGLKMLAGNPNRRVYNGTNQMDQAVSYVCLDYAGGHDGDAAWDERSDFFQHNCPNGMRTQIFFPSCWDGVNLDSANHQDHMAYPIQSWQYGDCPASHPVHLVSLFYEFVFDVGSYPYVAGQTNWVFANGDTTGLSMHADFTMGWPTGDNSVLQQAIDTCGDEFFGAYDKCAPLVPFIDVAASKACTPENGSIDEPNGWGSKISSLPGDNPIWSGTGSKPSNGASSNSTTTAASSSASATASPVAAVAANNALSLTSVSSKLPSGWAAAGCIVDKQWERALHAASFTAQNMTMGVCAAYCDSLNFPIAGTEWSTECYCDTEFRNGASSTTVADSECSMRCSGLSTENCGGPLRLSLLTKTASVRKRAPSLGADFVPMRRHQPKRRLRH